MPITSLNIIPPSTIDTIKIAMSKTPSTPSFKLWTRYVNCEGVLISLWRHHDITVQTTVTRWHHSHKLQLTAHIAHKYKMCNVLHRYSHTFCIIVNTYTKYIHNNDRYKIAYYSETVYIDQYFTPLRGTILCNSFSIQTSTTEIQYLNPQQLWIQPELTVSIGTKNTNIRILVSHSIVS